MTGMRAGADFNVFNTDPDLYQALQAVLEENDLPDNGGAYVVLYLDRVSITFYRRDEPVEALEAGLDVDMDAAKTAFLAETVGVGESAVRRGSADRAMAVREQSIRESQCD